MAATKNVRFPAEASRPHSAPAQPEPLLSFDGLGVVKRLSGFCFAPVGGSALCLNHDASAQKAYAALKPVYDWKQGHARNLDLMVGDGILQQAYTQARGNMRHVQDFVLNLSERLNENGRLVLRENALLVPEQNVLLELPDHRRKIGNVDPAQAIIKRLSEFSHAARPWLPEHLRGFFLEELPEMKPHTRLFRLPMKWAAEFLLRKDLNDDAWDDSLTQERIIGTERALRRQVFSPIGLRVLVHAPHWDTAQTDANISGAYQLYDEDKRPMSPLPTDMIIVLQKPAAHEGLWMAEQRTNANEPEMLSLNSVRETDSGDISTLVTGLAPSVHVLPWRRLPDDKIGVYMRPTSANPLTNMLKRSVTSIDGRRFSSHMPATVQDDMEDWEQRVREGMPSIASWLFDKTGLRVAPRTEVVEGKITYPAPDFIDQALTSVFIEVKDDESHLNNMVCYEASDILQAVHAGLIPVATLEGQLWQLANHAGLPLTLTTEQSVDIEIDERASNKLPVTPFEALCRKLQPESNKPYKPPFKDVKGHSGAWRVARSTFVEESTSGPQRAVEQEFVVNEEAPLHRAVLLCVTRRMDGEALAGFEMVDCPVPTRYGKPGTMVRMPSLPLPADIRSIPEARAHIAKQMDVRPIDVIPCGEAVFTHLGVTPQKLFPFIIKNPPWYKVPKVVLTTLQDIKRIIELDNTDSFLWIWGLAFKMLGNNTEATLDNGYDARAKARADATPAPPTIPLRVIAKNYG